MQPFSFIENVYDMNIHDQCITQWIWKYSSCHERVALHASKMSNRNHSVLIEKTKLLLKVVCKRPNHAYNMTNSRFPNDR